MNVAAQLTDTKKISLQDLSKELLYILAGSLLLALAARIAIPLPWTPIPLTFQTLAALFLGCQLGPTRSFFAVLTYIGESALGLPVLNCGTINPLAFIGPNAGYLWGMALEAAFMGYCAQKFSHSSLKLITSAFIAVALQLTMGMLWLGTLVGYPAAVYLGLLPFIGVELSKACVLVSTRSLFQSKQS